MIMIVRIKSILNNLKINNKILFSVMLANAPKEK